MVELAKEVLKQTGGSSPLVTAALPEDDPRQRRPDITKAQEILAWTPKVPLADGLGRTIAYFRERLKGLRVERA